MRLLCALHFFLAPVTQTPLPPRTAADLQSPRPDGLGRFGQFGGKYVPETLMPALSELEEAFIAIATRLALRPNSTVYWQTMWDGPARYILPSA